MNWECRVQIVEPEILVYCICAVGIFCVPGWGTTGSTSVAARKGHTVREYLLCIRIAVTCRILQSTGLLKCLWILQGR